uniref:Uncharacterized protein n=1 Tax=viral metagenome TaxID=1070528 RepID=A0A6M3XLC1_9ZZZZ
MSFNTVGGVDIADAVRLNIADTDSDDYEFSDSDFNTWLTHIVRKYSNYRPYVKETTIDHVADQDIYSLPSDFITMLECQYRLDFDTNAYAPIEDITLAGYSTYDFAALDLIRRQLRGAYDAIGRGHWEVITQRVSYAGGKFLIIYPAPSASTGDFTIRYGCVHPLASSDYFTIPAEHSVYFVDLLVAVALRRRAFKFLKNPMDYDAGQTRVRRGQGASGLLRIADGLEGVVWGALGSPVVAVG